MDAEVRVNSAMYTYVLFVIHFNAFAAAAAADMQHCMAAACMLSSIMLSQRIY